MGAASSTPPSSHPEQAQLLAANSLLDRGWGKPTQAIAGDSEGTPLIHEHRTAILAEISRIVAAGSGGGEGGMLNERQLGKV